MVLSYPQTDGFWVLKVFADSGGTGLVQANAVLAGEVFPPPGWMPAAILIGVNDHPEAIITVAAPAVPDSGIVELRPGMPPVDLFGVHRNP